MGLYARFPLIHFPLVGQLAVDKEIANLEEGALFCKLFYRIATVHEHALLAIQVGDGALATGGGAISWIVGEHPQFLVEMFDVNYGRPHYACQYRTFHLFACPIVDYGYCVRHEVDSVRNNERVFLNIVKFTRDISIPFGRRTPAKASVYRPVQARIKSRENLL
jgi:hypothetical protein